MRVEPGSGAPAPGPFSLHARVLGLEGWR